jgi:hypothetical protein
LTWEIILRERVYLSADDDEEDMRVVVKKSEIGIAF